MESGTIVEAGRSVPYVQRIVDGQRLRAYRLHQAAPDAPIVAMIHGLESSWDTWCPLRGDCLKRFTLFALDLPWTGQDGYYWCYARPADQWLDLTLSLLPAPPGFLVAHSYGVNVVLEYLQSRSVPSLAGLVLMSTFYRPDFAENDWMLFERCLKGFRAIFEEGIRLRRGKELDPALVSTMVDKVLDHVGPAGFMECFSHFLRSPTLRLDRIDVPALVIAGACDPGATAAGNAALAAGLPAASFVLFPDCGHFSMLQQPELVERAFRDFLTQHRPELLPPPVFSVERSR